MYVRISAVRAMFFLVSCGIGLWVFLQFSMF